MPDKLKQEAIAKYLAAWNTGDLEALDEVFAPNVIFHAPPYPDMDLAGVKQYIAGMRAGYPDIEVRDEETFFDGDRASCRYALQGTFTGQTTMMPAPPTGMQASAIGCSVFHWKDGTCVEAWTCGDVLGFLQESGIIPPMG